MRIIIAILSGFTFASIGILIHSTCNIPLIVVALAVGVISYFTANLLKTKG